MLKKLFSSTVAKLAVPEVKEIPAEVIHAEVDDLENICIQELKNILEATPVIRETKVISKADRMKSLGFGARNETIIEAEEQKKIIRANNDKIDLSKTVLEEMAEYRIAYPKDKIVPMSEFQKVLKKYNLIYAPATAYIKDVPEKNVIEMSEAKEVLEEHKPFMAAIISEIKVYNSLCNDNNIDPKELKIKLEPFLKKLYVVDIKSKFDLSYYKSRTFTNRDSIYYKITESAKKDLLESGITIEEMGCIYIDDMKSVDRSNLFIAAPKSHFDLNSLSTIDGKEYFTGEFGKVSLVETKDPIGFKLLVGLNGQEYVRILSKWGTDDDKSYLDPIVQDERHN